MMPPRAQRNFRLRKDLSVRVIKAWLELLRLEDGVLTWGIGTQMKGLSVKFLEDTILVNVWGFILLITKPSTIARHS